MATKRTIRKRSNPLVGDTWFRTLKEIEREAAKAGTRVRVMYPLRATKMLTAMEEVEPEEKQTGIEFDTFTYQGKYGAAPHQWCVLCGVLVGAHMSMREALEGKKDNGGKASPKAVKAAKAFWKVATKMNPKQRTGKSGPDKKAPKRLVGRIKQMVFPSGLITDSMKTVEVYGNDVLSAMNPGSEAKLTKFKTLVSYSGNAMAFGPGDVVELSGFDRKMKGMKARGYHAGQIYYGHLKKDEYTVVKGKRNPDGMTVDNLESHSAFGSRWGRVARESGYSIGESDALHGRALRGQSETNYGLPASVLNGEYGGVLAEYGSRYYRMGYGDVSRFSLELFDKKEADKRVAELTRQGYTVNKVEKIPGPDPSSKRLYEKWRYRLYGAAKKNKPIPRDARQSNPEKSNPNGFDRLDFQREGFKGGERFTAASGVSPARVDSKEIGQAFNIWAKYDGAHMIEGLNALEKSAAKREWIKGFKGNGWGGKGKRNPESDAAALYETFHGKPSTEVLEYPEDFRYHENLTALGDLIEFKVATMGHGKSGRGAKEVTIGFGGCDVKLASNEHGTQLYVVGGDQSVELEQFGLTGNQLEKEFVVLGVLIELTYQTAKEFHKFELTDYFHALGEESGVQPMLNYDRLNEQFTIAGGNYKVKDVGIVD